MDKAVRLCPAHDVMPECPLQPLCPPDECPFCKLENLNVNKAMKSACGEYECPCHDKLITISSLLHKVEVLLKELEFSVSEGDFCSRCPSCHQCAHIHLGERGHRDSCELGTVLKEIRRAIV